MSCPDRTDVLVIGDGAIGLSVAYQLLRDGLSVRLLGGRPPGQSGVGRQASWAGAGILPPASWYVDHPALDELAREAADAQPRWSAELRELSGVDDEYVRCGARYQLDGDDCGCSGATLDRWRRLGVEVELSTDEHGHASAFVPGEAQVRNPRRLHALRVACEQLGGRLASGEPVLRWERSGDRVVAVRTNAARYEAGTYCLAAGAWSPGHAESVGSGCGGEPVRGQMLLLSRDDGPIGLGIAHAPPFYAVERRDGRVLVGATVEHTGFDSATTTGGLNQLVEAAGRIDLRLDRYRVESHWAGLRPSPGADDGLPLVGRAPGVNNLWLATGHHRSGLLLSPPTARIVSQQVRGVDCPGPIDALDPALRGIAPAKVVPG